MPVPLQDGLQRSGEFEREERAVAPRHGGRNAAVERQLRPNRRRSTRAQLNPRCRRAKRPFEQHLDPAAGGLATIEARRQHARIVDDEEVTRADQVGEIREAEVFPTIFRRDVQQAAGGPLRQRRLGNQLPGEIVGEVARSVGPRLHGPTL